MIKMNPHPRLKLSKLRDIGWNLWDPIGLLSSGGIVFGRWTDEANRGFADEYDAYLISAASQLRRGEPSSKVIRYLVDIEANSMALGESSSSRERAEAVVEAILNDDSIWTWPDEKGRFSESD